MSTFGVVPALSWPDPQLCSGGSRGGGGGICVSADDRGGGSWLLWRSGSRSLRTQQAD